MSLVGTEHEMTMAHSKEENGMVERANKEVMRHLRSVIFDRNVLASWATYLPLVKRIFNASVHSLTGIAPAKILHGEAIDLNRNMIDVQSSETPVVYMDSWIESLQRGQREIITKVQKNIEKEKDKCVARSMGIEITEFEVGSFVLVEHVQNKLRRGPDSKLLPFLKGPMKVVQRKNDVYTLRNLVTQREKDYHVKRLHRYNCIVTVTKFSYLSQRVCVRRRRKV
jgi:hypothetical protein